MANAHDSPTVDPNKERREAVKRKITQYLKRAEEIFNCHLQRTAGNGDSTETVRSWKVRDKAPGIARILPPGVIRAYGA